MKLSRNMLEKGEEGSREMLPLLLRKASWQVRNQQKWWQRGTWWLAA